jgi:2-methylisoborneol synthase
MHSIVNTLDLVKSVLSSGPSGLGTKTTDIAAILNRTEKESDSEMRHRPPYRNDPALGEELNERLMTWAESIGLYDGHLDYLRKCNFGGYVMLSHPFSYDRERLFLAGQSMVALFALDDYFVDDERSGEALNNVGRNLSLCMSALDEPFSTEKYENETQEFLNANPIFVSLRQYIQNTARLGTPQQVARVRHEDAALFVSMCHEANWRLQKHIAPVWEYLSARQPNGFTPCLALIDVVDGYELPHDIYSLPKVRRVVKIAGLVTVMVNDLVSKDKELEAGRYQFGIREAIQKEAGCSYEEAHRLGIRFHNDLMRIFEDESRQLMVFAVPELRKFLIGLEAWVAGSYEWHVTSDRYTGD